MSAGNRIDVGPPFAIAGALLLLVSLFLDWYEPDLSGWTVFEALDLLLAAFALASLLGAAARMGLAIPGGRALANRYAVLGVLALVIVLSQVINHPPAAVGQDPETGLWLGLGGAGLLALGGVLSVTRISFAVDVEEREPAPPRGTPAARPGASGRAGSAADAPPRPGGEAETTPLDTPPPGREQR